MAIVLAVPPRANAAFVNQYDLSNFTLTNPDGSAFFETLNNGQTLIFWGPNDGNGLTGFADLTIPATAAGIVSFTWSYATLDLPDYDAAGYLIGDVFTQLAASDGQMGQASFSVAAGQVFGFRISSFDNTGEPGVLKVVDFNAPASAVPEPSSFVCLLVVGAIACARSRFRKHLGVIAGLVAVLPVVAQQQAHYTGSNITGQLQLARVVNVLSKAQTIAMRGGVTAFKAGPVLPEHKKLPPAMLRPQAAMRMFGGAMMGALTAPTLQSLTVGPAAGIFGFQGLSHRDQRLANNGNQFSIEPPSQSIAAANGYILEGVNNAIQIYSISGTPAVGKTLSTNELFGLPPAIDRTTGGANGPYPTDMRVFHDQTINRWFILQRAQDYNIFGEKMHSSRIYLAVSQTPDPTGNYNIYEMDTTNAANPGCPCLSDFPQIGADQYGFYISVNEFTTFSEWFLNAAIFAVSKASLAAGAALPVTYKFHIPFTNGFEFAIQPATTPPGASPFLANGGLEFFVSTNGRTSADSNMAVWAMYNTSSLNTPSPNLFLVQNVFPTLTYVFPNVATQRPGPLPYGSTLFPPNGILSFIDGGDNRVLSATYSAGRLYATLASQTTDDQGRSVVGGAYVIFSPTFRSGVLAAPVLRQGFLATRNNHLLRPAIAVNSKGRGAISMTLVGPDYYPSAAFVPIDTFSTGPIVYVAAPGAFPEDGWTGYETGVARWGDYSAAVAASDGSIWMGMQLIPNALRTELANWGTYIARYVP
jgi:hypothetical protein